MRDRLRYVQLNNMRVNSFIHEEALEIELISDCGKYVMSIEVTDDEARKIAQAISEWADAASAYRFGN